MVSMKDIAQRCGVSVATVSKALNDQKDISKEKKAMIREAAEEMGYMTNSAARALKTNRTYNIGVLFVDEQESGLTHEFFSAVLNALKEEAEGSGYDITFINRNAGYKSTGYLQHCLYRGVDGVVIACVDFNDPQVQELVASQIPVVTIDHVFNDTIAVLSDNFIGVAELVKYAYKQGHRRIAFIHGERTAVTNNRLVGFYRTCEELGIEIPDNYVRLGAFHDAETCGRVTREMMKLEERPTCIIFPDDYSALGGLNALRDLDLRIPEDISVMGYDGVKLAQILSPPLTTYRQNTEMMGRMAARRLVELIEHPKTTMTDTITVNGQLMKGGTVARIKE